MGEKYDIVAEVSWPCFGSKHIYGSRARFAVKGSEAWLQYLAGCDGSPYEILYQGDYKNCRLNSYMTSKDRWDVSRMNFDEIKKEISTLGRFTAFRFMDPIKVCDVCHDRFGHPGDSCSFGNFELDNRRLFSIGDELGNIGSSFAFRKLNASGDEVRMFVMTKILQLHDFKSPIQKSLCNDCQHLVISRNFSKLAEEVKQLIRRYQFTANHRGYDVDLGQLETRWQILNRIAVRQQKIRSQVIKNTRAREANFFGMLNAAQTIATTNTAK